ncbi:hypothetical protein OPV22_030098 [Ensete ventricosum]|uniref:RING-type domain-containing protein n=1 Tax=Ensete ventricosum TaxID=4639 RepID=A0AAV8Q573_ENSVE|nr:hypothetical protein OPV22_030098 [Ensete ventricosum]
MLSGTKQRYDTSFDQKPIEENIRILHGPRGDRSAGKIKRSCHDPEKNLLITLQHPCIPLLPHTNQKMVPFLCSMKGRSFATGWRRRDEVLQEIRGVHAGEEGKGAACPWIEAAEENTEEVWERIPVPASEARWGREQICWQLCRLSVRERSDLFFVPIDEIFLIRADYSEDDELVDETSSRCRFNPAPLVCDGTFFPSLLKEMSAVVVCFNQRSQKLLKLHLASGFWKFILWLRGKSPNNDGSLTQEGKDLVAYAIINSIAMRKILKKYDKVHYSKQGQAFRSKAPTITELYNDCSLTFDDDGKPTLSCGLFDSMQIEIDLTCSICLDTIFDPVALTCGHLFCYMCCCAAASVTIVDGLKAADPKAKCPLCRQEGVNAGAMHLVELKILLSQSCSEYWEKRCQTERVERVRQAKEHWQSVCREFMGM